MEPPTIPTGMYAQVHNLYYVPLVDGAIIVQVVSVLIVMGIILLKDRKLTYHT